jgi:hypothetical protein
MKIAPLTRVALQTRPRAASVRNAAHTTTASRRVGNSTSVEGQFRHFERAREMSAMPPIATKNGEPLKRRRRARSRRRAAARERQAPVEGPAPPLAWPVVHSAAAEVRRASRRLGPPRKPTPASSSATPTVRRSPTSIARMNRVGVRLPVSSPATRRGASPPTSPSCRSGCVNPKIFGQSEQGFVTPGSGTVWRRTRGQQETLKEPCQPSALVCFPGERRPRAT